MQHVSAAPYAFSVVAAMQLSKLWDRQIKACSQSQRPEMLLRKGFIQQKLHTQLPKPQSLICKLSWPLSQQPEMLQSTGLIWQSLQALTVELQ